MHKQQGFTIPELVIVILIMGLLATIVGVAWRATKENALDTTAKSDIVALRAAIDKYYRDNGEYPMPSGCSYSSGMNKECYSGELAQSLVPKYLDSLPKDPNDADYGYVVRHGGSTESDRFGIRVYFKNEPACMTGTNLTRTWWGSLPECSF